MVLCQVAKGDVEIPAKRALGQLGVKVGLATILCLFVRSQ